MFDLRATRLNDKIFKPSIFSDFMNYVSQTMETERGHWKEICALFLKVDAHLQRNGLKSVAVQMNTHYYHSSDSAVLLHPYGTAKYLQADVITTTPEFLEKLIETFPEFTKKLDRKEI